MYQSLLSLWALYWIFLNSVSLFSTFPRASPPLLFYTSLIAFFFFFFAVLLLISHAYTPLCLHFPPDLVIFLLQRPNSSTGIDTFALHLVGICCEGKPFPLSKSPIHIMHCLADKRSNLQYNKKCRLLLWIVAEENEIRVSHNASVGFIYTWLPRCFSSSDAPIHFTTFPTFPGFEARRRIIKQWFVHCWKSGPDSVQVFPYRLKINSWRGKVSSLRSPKVKLADWRKRKVINE